MITTTLSEEDVQTMQTITNTIKHESLNCCNNLQEEDSMKTYEQILKMIPLSMKMMSNAYYKNTKFLELSEVEQIKSSLNNYAKDNKDIDGFKRVIIDDLTEFQNQIKTQYSERLNELIKQKQLCEKQLRIADYDKNKLIMDRLAKIVWPYDQKTKEYDLQITKLQTQIQKYNQKIEELKQMKPIATEKDIILYQMAFKNKYQIVK